MLEEIEGIGAQRMTGYLGDLPRTQTGIDFFGEFGAFVLKILNFFADIEFVVSANQSQFANLCFQLSNWLFKI